MNKKNIFGFGLGVVSLVACAVLMLGQTSKVKAGTPRHVEINLLSGAGYVSISNNVAISYTSTNYWYLSATGTNVLAGAGITNSIQTNVVPGAFVDSGFNGVFCNANGDILTNVCLGIVIGDTNFVPPIYENQFLQPTASNTSMIALTAASTNLITVVLQRGNLGTNFGSTAQDKFTVAFNANGLTPAVFYTNLPATFMVGTKTIRVLSITVDNASTSPGEIISRLGLSAYLP